MMRGYIQARAEALAGEGSCHRQLLAAVKPAPLARRVLRRFIHVAHHRARTRTPA
jgi:GMP synthase (glutamine-hydrolysing)